MCSLSVRLFLFMCLIIIDICNFYFIFHSNVISLKYLCMTQAEGVYNQRLQNLAVTLDKVIVPPCCLVASSLFLFYMLRT